MISAHYCRHIFFVFLFCVLSRNRSLNMFSFGRNSLINAEFWMSKICKMSQLTIDWLVERTWSTCFELLLDQNIQDFKISASKGCFSAGGLPFDWHDCVWQHLHFPPCSLWQRRDGQVSFQRTSISVNHQLQDRSLSFSRWWFHIFFNFHPYLGKIPILTNIFQRGWNHQLEAFCVEILHTSTLPAIIMVQVENGCISNISFLTFRVIFHFHAYGRKGSSVLLKGLYVSNHIFWDDVVFFNHQQLEI